VVLRGEAGEGKTTLAGKPARWLVSRWRFDWAAFISPEDHGVASDGNFIPCHTKSATSAVRRTYIWAVSTG